MRTIRDLSAPQRVAAGAALVGLLTIIFWAAGTIHDAATLTAYATTLLAIGTASLAFGAIGTYVEQRRANLESAARLVRQDRQLEAAKENDVAQVAVRRTSGPGEYLRIEVANHSSRVIRFVYAWATVDGMTGHYLTVVPPDEYEDSTAFASRRMQHLRRRIDDRNMLEWCYRSMLPGMGRTFQQFHTTNPDAIPSSVGDTSIRAYALFTDVNGDWWICSEDGTVDRLAEEPPLVGEPTRPSMGRSISPGRTHRA